MLAGAPVIAATGLAVVLTVAVGYLLGSVPVAVLVGPGAGGGHPGGR